ncbi:MULTISPECIES: DUF5681 domain-containing protein [Asticcacaulis]|uniref:DUF5681 domain-containing protein n=1 Tax=Asticcacaulis TaxID=76890 RepID=UPI001AE4C04A|nr:MULTISPECIES: hypothetical protein [Asticcacaulis]MBP2159551.1 hypothetical protein [Asticcacaulis solisilvae]MDR6800622.1 hypothetical protein [Asticcacaulis sp. BE141]
MSNEHLDETRKNGRTTAGRFGPGNPGRPQGARHKATLAIEALLEGEAEALGRKAIEMALAGDAAALRLCMDRLAPPRKGRTVTFDIPGVDTSRDIVKALQALMSAVAGGEVTPEEAVSISSVLEVKRKAIETIELEARLAKLEQAAK